MKTLLSLILPIISFAQSPVVRVASYGNPLQYLRMSPNTANTPQWSALPVLVASDYVFSAQTPGGSLTAATQATVALSPCPLGVAGANTNYYMYVSAGTGTAEAVLITGGTCTSGASSGNVTFTPANNHTGSWTIQSASGGIEEAISLLPAITTGFSNIGAGGGTVLVPTGTISVRGTIYLPGNTKIEGVTKGGSILAATAASQIVISTVTQSSQSSVTNLTINLTNQASAIALDINSECAGQFTDLGVFNAYGGSAIGVRMRTSSNGVENSTLSLNATNLVKNVAVWGGTALQMVGDLQSAWGGSGVGDPITANWIENLIANSTVCPAVELVTGADHNYFVHNSLACGAAGSGTGHPVIVVNDYGATAQNQTDNNQFENTLVDSSYTSGTIVGVQINYSQGTRLAGMRTATITAGNLWVQNSNATSVEANGHLSYSNASQPWMQIPDLGEFGSYTSSGTFYSIIQPNNAGTNVLFGSSGVTSLFQSLTHISLNSSTTLPGDLNGTQLHLIGADSFTNNEEIDTFGQIPSIVLRRSDGTLASQSGIASTAIFGQIEGRAYMSTGAYTNSARATISFYTTEAWSGTGNGSMQGFGVTPTGSTTIADAMRLYPTGLSLSTNSLLFGTFFYEDTNLSRDSAGVIDFGTGSASSTAGSWKATNGTLSGNINVQSLQLTGGTKFTVSGCGTAGSLLGGASAGKFTVGTGASPCTFVITINGATGLTATDGWGCVGSDQTTGIILPQSGSLSTTTCTIKGNAATSDVITFHAWAY